MKSPGTTAAKVVFSVIGVACLVLSGVTGYNYARTMEAFAVVTLEPVSLTVEAYKGLIAVNVTYKVDNPARLAVELIWSQALVTMYDGGGEFDFLNYRSFAPGEMRVEPGESREFEMRGFAKQSLDPDLYIAVLNRTQNAFWSSYCSMYFEAVDFDFSNHRYDEGYWVREVE